MEDKQLTKKGQEVRDRILLKTRDVLVKKGLDHLVMRDIAAACDMKLGNLQYYFKSREELLFAVIQRESIGDIRVIEDQLANSVEARATLETILERLLSRWLKEDGAAVYAMLNLYQLHRQNFRALYQDIYERHYKALEAVIKQLKPEVPASERRMRAQLLTALIDGALAQVVSGSSSKFTRRVTEQAIAIALAD